jgi:hypothetical protein
MPFIHPGLLWFLPLAAIPILLHLLTLHRLKTVELSTFRFLFDSYVQQRRRMQFLEALLAMLRTLFILFLVLMVTRPVLKEWKGLFKSGGGSGGREVILVVDCSASMNARSGGQTAFERAKAAALAVIKRLDAGDNITLIRLGGKPEEVFSHFNRDAQEARDKIKALTISSGRGNMLEALLYLFGPGAPQRNKPAVYLFTDCQASGWREIARGFNPGRGQGLERLLPPKTPFVVVNAGAPESLPNQAVVGDAPRQGRAVAGLPVVLQPRVVNYSKTEQAELTLAVFVDGKEFDRKALKLQPGETALPRLKPYLPAEPGIKNCRFEITSRTDRFPDDNEFRFTLNVVPRVRVLLINGNPLPDPVEDEGRFLKIALTSNPDKPPADGKTGPQGPLESREFQRSLDVREIPETGLNAEALRETSVVVLANCGRLNVQQDQWLREFVADGGGLLIFPGDKVNPDVYNQQFLPVPGPQGESLTAARLGKPEGDPERSESFEQLSELNFDHPALAVFDNPDPKVRHFATVRIYKRFPLTLPDKPRVSTRGSSNAWPLARFSSGAPALVEGGLGDGRVILAAFPAHPRWSNLPTKPDFVPLVLRLVGHVQRRAEVEVPPAVPAGAAAVVSVQRSWEPAEAEVRRLRGPASDKKLERVGQRLLASFEETTLTGYYTAEVKSTRSGVGKSATVGFGVNLPPEESDLTPVSEKQLRDLLPNVELRFLDASAEAKLRTALGEQQEVWRPLWFIVLFTIIALEFLMATTGGRKKDTEDGGLDVEGQGTR